jgi:fucose 4-O-acetylase-like acetyltransferase
MSDKAMARIGWIDEFKGFVLLLVCLFHMEQSFSNVDMGMLHLGALRMSAFFFISGMLFSTRRFPNFKSYLVHKTRVLLLPYIFLSLLFLLLDPVLYNFEWFPRAPRMTVMNIHPVITGTWDYIYWNLAKIFVAGKSSIGSGPLWFVFTLYSVSLLFYGVQKIAGRIKAPRVATALIAIASLAGGWFLYVNHIRLPLGIERDLTVFFFFANGWLCKGALKDPRLREDDVRGKNILALVAAAILAFIVYAFIEIPDPNFSIMNNDLGKSFPVFLASSVFGIVGLVAAFMFADKLPNIVPIRIAKGILRNISRNALIILAIHWYIFLVLRIIFKTQIDRPGIAYLSAFTVIAGIIGAIPLFRCKLYRLLGKEKISARESLSIKD